MPFFGLMEGGVGRGKRAMENHDKSPARFRPQSDFFTFYVLGNDGRNVVKNGFPMDAQMRKIVTNRQTNHEKKTSRKPAHENDKTRWNTTPPKLDFRIPSHTESQFQLFHICWDCVPNGTQSPSKLRSAGAFGAKIWYERGLKHTQKVTIRKVRKYVKNVTQKGTPKNNSFVVFRGLEPKASQGGPKDPPEPLPRSNLVRICTKKGARNCISVMFY